MSNNYFPITPYFQHCGFMGKLSEFLPKAERVYRGNFMQESWLVSGVEWRNGTETLVHSGLWLTRFEHSPETSHPHNTLELLSISLHSPIPHPLVCLFWKNYMVCSSSGVISGMVCCHPWTHVHKLRQSGLSGLHGCTQTFQCDLWLCGTYQRLQMSVLRAQIA